MMRFNMLFWNETMTVFLFHEMGDHTRVENSEDDDGITASGSVNTIVI